MISRGDQRKVVVLKKLIDECESLFHTWRKVSLEVRGGQRSVVEWWVLRHLAEAGPCTVPELARERGSSRQQIQAAVNRLRARRFVELTSNPSHRRSHVVRITPAGTAGFSQASKREEAVLRSLPLGTGLEDCETAGAVLAGVRTALGGG